MNLDLGNPARHLARVLEQSVLPLRGRPSCIERLSSWTHSPKKLKDLKVALEEIARSSGHEAKAAKRALQTFGENRDEEALHDYLSARDLVQKSGGQNYRKEAYRRLLLWTELLKVMEGVDGPVVLIDEAENLYTSGVAEVARRSALRTLAFYCGGALPGACVILAMTPPALTQMRKESQSLLKEAADLDSTLDLEDVELFRHRLFKLKPDEVPALSSALRRELAQKVKGVHRQVRGRIEIEDWDEIVKELVRRAGTPRALMRSLVDQLEATWWSGS